MRGNAAHRIDRDRPANDFVVRAPVHVRPPDRQHDRLLERDLRHLQRDAMDGRGRHPALGGDGLGRVAMVEIALGHEREHRLGAPAVGQVDRCEQRRSDPGQEGILAALHVRIHTPEVARTSRARRPVATMPGVCTTSQGAFVYLIRNSQSMSPRLSRTCTRASASKPSVPGQIGSHSSAIAE